jgi:hypothetical protein
MSDRRDVQVSRRAKEAPRRAAARESRRLDAQARKQRKADQRRAAAAWAGKKSAVRLAPDEILLVSNEERMFVRARLDDGYPVFAGGYGGWEDVPRPGQVAATVYRGTAAPQLTLRLILGGWPQQPAWADCDRDMRVLDHFSRLAWDATGRERPTLLRVSGKVPHHHRRWFVDDLQWEEVDVAGGRRVRAFVTLTLRMYVPVQLLERRDGPARPTEVYSVRRGETLDQIVRHKLDARGSRETAKARNVVLRLNRLRRGVRLSERQHIKLPVGGWWRNERAGR